MQRRGALDNRQRNEWQAFI